MTTCKVSGLVTVTYSKISIIDMYFFIHFCIFIILAPACDDWSAYWLRVLHSKPFEHKLNILGLRYKYAIVLLCNLKAQEEWQLSHHWNFKLILHTFTKYFAHVISTTPKDNVVNIYYCDYHSIFFQFNLNVVVCNSFWVLAITDIGPFLHTKVLVPASTLIMTF